MRAAILANGEIQNYEALKPYLKKDDYVICADGGLRHAEKLGLSPNLVMGDMDSVSSFPEHVQKVIFPVRKNATDGQIVIEYALEQGFSELLLLGFFGGRADHFLTNMFLLTKTKEIDALMAENGCEIRLCKRENIISGKPGDVISIIPLSETLSGITTQGLDYPLADGTLYFGDSRGNSNVMTGTECRISTKNGTGLIIKEVQP